jgi:cyclic pyranopterin phosphate synthase
MVNITHKSYTLRKAIATAVVRTSLQETIDAIEQRSVSLSLHVRRACWR